MLKGIPKSFTPGLLKLLMAMGHGEQVLFSDGNFPPVHYRDIPKIYIPAVSITGLLEDVLKFFPLDAFVPEAAVCMEGITDSPSYEPYKRLIKENGSAVKLVERFAFYELVNEAAGIVVTADTTKCGNIMIKKGVVKDEDI